MAFFQVEFFIFFFITVVLLFVVNSLNVRKTILLLASYYFYAYWDYRFLGLIVIVTLLNFYISLWIEKTDNILKRKSLFITILIINLCLLGLFKYYNFFHSLIRRITCFIKYRSNNTKSDFTIRHIILYF